MASSLPPRYKGDRLLLHVTCQCHEGAAGYANLVVTKNGRTIVLNPHVDNSCVLTLDEVAVDALHEMLGAWLNGLPRVRRSREGTSTEQKV